MAGVSKETQMSIEATSMFPGFRFSPTDVELISYYLKKKMEGDEKCVEVISEVDICKHEPWDLPGKAVIQSENEWFFFSARGRKYPNGSQSRRATEHGYWKATGKERNVKSGSTVIGTKRTLVFHIGRAPKGERTEWIMHEYCMDGKSQDSLVVCRLRKNVEFRGNDNSNRTAQSLRQLSISDGGLDRDKTAECSKKSTSSYDSHSVEQLDSASESEHKLSNQALLADSCSQQQEDSDNEDDFYADILKDDIVKLDETSLPAMKETLPSSAAHTPTKVQTEAQQSTLQTEAQKSTVELIMTQQVLPSQNVPQGTANRRIKLKKQVTVRGPAETSSKDKQPKCVVDLLSRKTGRHNVLYVVFVILISLALLLLSFDRGFLPTKRVGSSHL